MRHYRVRFDGSCANNGSADATGAFGWQVVDLDGFRPVAAGSGVVADELVSNNVAEWRGLITALSWVSCLADRPADLSVEGDSQLVIHQLTGAWKCKKPHLASLRAEASAALKRIGCRWNARWIPREQNAECDELSRPA